MYVPEDKPDGFTETVIVPGAVPEAGLSVSHEPPEADAVNVSEPLVVLSVNFCEGGIVVPPA